MASSLKRYLTDSEVTGMFYLYSMFKGCFIYSQCSRDVLSIFNVQGMFYLCSMFKGCFIYVQCSRDVLSIVNVQGMFYL